jgi:hypothetical protein
MGPRPERQYEKDRAMKRNTVITAIAIILSVGLAGCRSRLAPLYDVKSAHLGNERKSVQRLGQDIRAAGRALGWEMKEEGEGKIGGSIWVRGTHKAIVVITYNTTTFNITHSESNNLRYNKKSHLIHKNYNQWVKRLESAIKRKVAN